MSSEPGYGDCSRREATFSESFVVPFSGRVCIAGMRSVRESGTLEASTAILLNPAGATATVSGIVLGSRHPGPAVTVLGNCRQPLGGLERQLARHLIGVARKLA